MKKLFVCAMAALFVLGGCGRRNTVHDAHDHAKENKKEVHAADDDHVHGAACTDGHGDVAEESDEIIFTPEQAARTEFEVREAERTKFREVIKCGGEISAARNDITVITAPVSGVVTFTDGRLTTSSRVTGGQDIFHISSGGLASGDAIARAEINYNQAKADFERIKSLYEDKLVTHKEYLDAEAVYLMARSEYEPLKNYDEEKGTPVTSPFSGYVTRIMVNSGEYVETGAPLAYITKSNRMQLTALVSQRYFDRIGNITDANFRAPSSDEYFNVSALRGRLTTSGRVVSKGSTLVPVVFELDNNGRFADGAFVEAALLGRERDNVLTLPLSAITEQQGLYYVYVQIDEEGYVRREVRLGVDDGMNVEILSGIRSGERVVTKGAVNVKMAASSGAIPHGHAH